MIDFIRNYCLIYLFFTILSTFCASEKYQKYLQFFIELTLMLCLLTPILSVFHSSFEETFDRMIQQKCEEIEQQEQIKEWEYEQNQFLLEE